MKTARLILAFGGMRTVRLARGEGPRALERRLRRRPFLETLEGDRINPEHVVSYRIVNSRGE